MNTRLMMMGLAGGLLAAVGAHGAEDEIGCERLVVHQPDASVAYQPGVTVRGDRVVPADLNSGLAPADIVPERITVAITVDLAARLGIPAAGDANFTGEAHIGLVDATPDGRVWFNGQLLTAPAAYELSRACQVISRE